MMKRLLKRRLSDRRGISIAEGGVAMTMVLIVTGAAISVQISSARADAAYRDKYQVLNACENAVSCLRFAGGDSTKLKEVLEKAGFVEGSEGDFAFTSGDYEVVVAHEDERYVVEYGGEIIYEQIQYDWPG